MYIGYRFTVNYRICKLTFDLIIGYSAMLSVILVIAKPSSFEPVTA